MGFDNECILNIQSLPGEYFCPVCRTLIFPNEALQSQCTHLFCKPCLSYVVATTHACPYDGYLVTEADSKPLLELNKSLAETVGKVQVYCLFHRSGCQWQGALSDCVNHCTGCNFGNSPVVCNRCGTQIVHRQVQEHAQTCPGLQPQGQQIENAQAHALPASNQDAAVDSSATTLAPTMASSLTAAMATNTPSLNTATSASMPANVPITASAANAIAQAQNQVVAVGYSQAGMPAPMTEQWYRQQHLQYQQYYQQQYPGYDPYQQQYQQYSQYQQQNFQQYPQTTQVAPQQVVQVHQQVQPYVQQPLSNTQPHPQPQPQAQLQTYGTQLQAQQQPAIQAQLQPQHQLPGPPQPMSQPQNPSQHTHHQPQLQAQLLSHSQYLQGQNIPVQQPHQQIHPQITPQVIQPSVHPGQQPHHPQSQQPYPQLQQQPTLHAQPSQSAVLPQQLPQPSLQQQQLHPQSQTRSVSLPQAQPYSHAQPQFQQPHMQQPRPLLQAQPQPLIQTQNPSAHGVTGHQSYPQTQPPIQQVPHVVPQRPMNSQQLVVPQQAAQTQFSIHQAQQMRPSQTHIPMQTQQYSAMQSHAQPPFLNTASHQAAQHLVHQQSGQQIPHPVGMQMQPQQQALGHFPSAPQSQQSGFPPQTHSHSSQQSLRPQVQPYIHSQLNSSPGQGRTLALNQPPQQAPRSPGKPIQSGMNQHSPTHNLLASQHVSIHQPQLHPGNQGSIVSSTPLSETHAKHLTMPGSDGKPTMLDKSADSMPDRDSQVKQLDATGTAVIADGSEASRSSELEIFKADNLCKNMAEGEKPIATKEYSEIKENKDNFQVGEGSTSQAAEGIKETHAIEAKKNAKSNPATELSLDGSNASRLLHENNKIGEKSDQGFGVRNQVTVNAVQGTPQHDLEAHEKAFPPSGFHDKGASQFPPPQAGSVGLRGIPSGPPGHERYPTQNIPHGHLTSLDVAMVSQRPGPDGMFSQAASSHERRLQDSFSQPNLLHVPPPAGQPRPPGYLESFPISHAMTEPFPPPAAKQLYSLNLPLRNAEEINPFSARSQIHGLPPSAVGPPIGQFDSLPMSGIGGPPPGSFDATSGVINRGSQFGFEDQGGRPPVNLMEGPGYYDGRQPDFHRSMPGEHTPFVQHTSLLPNAMKMNGLSGKGPAGMHDSAFSDSVPDYRFRPPGERFKPWTEEGFRSESFKSMMNPGRSIANHREFDEDMKQFPRPSNLDGDAAHIFNAYGPASRSIDRLHHFGPDFGPKPFDRVFPPPPPSGGRFPPSSDSLEFGSFDTDRQRGPPFLDETHPDRLRPFSEFGRPRFDSLPPISPGHFRKEIDAFDVSHDRLRSSETAAHGLANNSKVGEPYGARNLPAHLRFTDSAYHAPLHGGEPGGFCGYGPLPIGDSGLSNSYSGHDSAFLHGDVDGFEHSRKRKPASLGWCRLCKIDCETVEALEVHAQTKDHQNTAMEIVLNIKKENAKKQILASDESMDTNKSRKSSFENRRR